ncbi:SapC family protein [Sphingomonas sp. 37zxx]|uniref:SapC family protein n=1 Tax=Sphingomonas sp. 37zxx TaxID=1550073 RepID=UPI00053BFE78|nr:SapC family protein [Sphingomonas sp. 37zxx]
MTAIRPLDRTRHAGLCVQPLRGAAARRLAQVGISEIALAAADTPLCLAKDAHTGRFNLIALMGLVEPGNLFSHDGAIGATYVPRAAMLTGFRLDPAGEAGLAVDEDDPSLGPQGEALFDATGTTALADRLRAELDHIIADVAAAQALIDTYARLRLICRLRLNLRFDDNRVHAIEGLYSLAGSALATLDDASIVAMHRAGQLAPAAIITASLSQIERLRQLHNARHDRIRAIDITIDED